MDVNEFTAIGSDESKVIKVVAENEELNKDIDISGELYELYDRYKEEALCNRRLKNSDVEQLLTGLSRQPEFDIRTIGHAVENRKIFQVKLGNGKTKVLIWSQMHGNESTGTMAMFDIFNFFKRKDEFDEIKKVIQESLTIYFIPMLNPDGAAVYKRRNALGIDLNRDAVRLQAPESKLLNSLVTNIQFDFAFNLHDQDKTYKIGKKPSTMSFLAPAYNAQKNVNKIRQNAMQLICGLNKQLSKFIPNQIGRYEDNYNPNCFGDDFQKRGISTVLFEAGNYYLDTEKQYVRKVNFVALLSALVSVAVKSYEEQDVKLYKQIPENEKGLYDLIIRNVTVETKGKSYTLDLGVEQQEVNFPDFRSYYTKGVYSEIGDMSNESAYQELNATNFKFVQGKVFPGILKRLSELNEANILALLDLGYTTVRVKRLPYGRDFSRLPIHVIPSTENTDNEIALGKTANFVLQKKGKTQYAVINGLLYDLVSNL